MKIAPVLGQKCHFGGKKWEKCISGIKKSHQGILDGFSMQLLRVTLYVLISELD